MGKRDDVAAAVPGMPGMASFTPGSAGGVERVLRLLRHYYPQRPEEECRDALAAMYAHASWSALEAAAARGETSAWDENEDAGCVRLRHERQWHVAMTRLGGVTDEAASAAGRLEKELQSAAAQSISKRHDPDFKRKRIERARHAYHTAYAKHAMLEIRPTAQDRLPIAADDDMIEAHLRIDLLPRALTVWLEHQRPRMTGLAGRISALRVRQHSQCDLLNFAFAWGEACVAHPTDIPESLQVYPIALCAKWFAWNAVGAAVAKCGTAMPRLAGDGEGPLSGRVATLDPLRDHEAVLMRAQPREDLASLLAPVVERQILAGHALIRTHVCDAASATPIQRFVSKPAWTGDRRAAAGAPLH